VWDVLWKQWISTSRSCMVAADSSVHHTAVCWPSVVICPGQVLAACAQDAANFNTQSYVSCCASVPACNKLSSVWRRLQCLVPGHAPLPGAQAGPPSFDCVCSEAFYFVVMCFSWVCPPG
jgi:hypothetical protein